MNTNLVEIVNGVSVVSSREIAEKFEKRHSDIIAKIEGKSRPDGKMEMSLLKEIECTGNPVCHYFIKNELPNKQNGQTYTEYLITRDGFSLLVMGFTGQKALEWKLKYIDAFNKMESHIAQMNAKGNLLLSIYNGGQEAVVAAKELTKLEVEQAITPLLETIAEQQPAVDFTNTVTKSCDNILMRDMAKLLCDQHISIGEKKLYKLLREHDVLMRSNDPYQSFVDRGYFFVKEQPYSTPYGEKLNRTTLVTPKGQIWIVSKTKEWLKVS